jgi:hypothetical protein
MAAVSRRAGVTARLLALAAALSQPAEQRIHHTQAYMRYIDIE